MSWQLGNKQPKRGGQPDGTSGKKAKVGEVLAITAGLHQQQQQQQQQQQSGAASSKDNPRHDRSLSMAMQLIDQLESRLREVEGVMFDTVRLPAADARVEAGKQALRAYSQVVAEQGPGHENGPPHVHLFASVLGALADQPVNEESLATRAFSLRMLRASLLQQDLQDVTMWVRSFKVVDMYQKQGESQMARVQWHLKGSIRVPPMELWQEMRAREVEAEKAGGLASLTLAKLAAGEFVEGIFTPAPEARGKVVQIQALLTSFLCSTGAVRYMGRAPRGGLAYQLHKSIKGKGKGKGGRGGMDED